jgi:hypothetical protein
MTSEKKNEIGADNSNGRVPENPQIVDLDLAEKETYRRLLQTGDRLASSNYSQLFKTLRKLA